MNMGFIQLFIKKILWVSKNQIDLKYYIFLILKYKPGYFFALTSKISLLRFLYSKKISYFYTVYKQVKFVCFRECINE